MNYKKGDIVKAVIGPSFSGRHKYGMPCTLEYTLFCWILELMHILRRGINSLLLARMDGLRLS
jgi:hypothetical protein